MLSPGQTHLAAGSFGLMTIVSLLGCKARQQCMDGEEERLRALRAVCSALPRTAQALQEQARQLSCAQTDRRAVSELHGSCACGTCMAAQQLCEQGHPINGMRLATCCVWEAQTACPVPHACCLS